MLSKKYRLPIQNFVGKKGVSGRSRYFLLKIFPGVQKFSRFGIIISSKVSKKSVDRNRIKRQIFNFMRETKNQLPINDYLIIIHPEAAKLDKKNLKIEIAKILKLKN